MDEAGIQTRTTDRQGAGKTVKLSFPGDNKHEAQANSRKSLSKARIFGHCDTQVY